MNTKETVGFIGVGHMGRPMALNLLRAGYTLRVYDIDPAKTASLAQHGAIPVSSPGDAVLDGGLVLSMVPNDAALEAIISRENGILQRIGAGGVHVSLSTISPACTARVAPLYAEQGSSYVAATVSGRPDVAAAAQLSIFYAGPSAAKARVGPLLPYVAIPEHVYDLGEQQTAAAGAKLAINYIITAIILALADSAALAGQYEVSIPTFIQLIQQSPLFSGKVFSYGDMLVTNNYTPALFPVPLGEKDVKLMLDAAGAVGVPLPSAERYLTCLQEATKAGWDDQDWAVAARVILEKKGCTLAGC